MILPAVSVGAHPCVRPLTLGFHIPQLEMHPNTRLVVFPRFFINGHTLLVRRLGLRLRRRETFHDWRVWHAQTNTP